MIFPGTGRQMGGNIMNIAVLGTGAIGSLFACRLAQNPAHRILCVVSRPSRALQIRQNGITITEPDGRTLTAAGENLRAVHVTEGESPADLVLITVKSHTTRKALLQHPSLFGPQTTALTLQNGYGNHEDLLSVLPAEQVFMGTTAQAVNIREDGTILHAADGITRIGAPDTTAGTASDTTSKIQSVLQDAGFETEIPDDIRQAVLRKLLINIAINPICALHDVPNKYIISDRQMETHARLLVQEAIDILALEGWDFDFEIVWHEIRQVAEKTGENICSMLQDIRNGKETEIQKINGAIVTMAHRHHADAPLNHRIVQEVEQLRAKN